MLLKLKIFFLSSTFCLSSLFLYFFLFIRSRLASTDSVQKYLFEQAQNSNARMLIMRTVHSDMCDCLSYEKAIDKILNVGIFCKNCAAVHILHFSNRIFTVYIHLSWSWPLLFNISIHYFFSSLICY